MKERKRRALQAAFHKLGGRKTRSTRGEGHQDGLAVRLPWESGGWQAGQRGPGGAVVQTAIFGLYTMLEVSVPENREACCT